jgi:hypothetical protein
LDLIEREAHAPSARILRCVVSAIELVLRSLSVDITLRCLSSLKSIYAPGLDARFFGFGLEGASRGPEPAHKFQFQIAKNPARRSAPRSTAPQEFTHTAVDWTALRY